MLLTMLWIIWIIIAFFCGSIPFGVLIARSKGVDIRNAGSGNPGATNVGRVLGTGFGVACFLLDAMKGAGPVLLAGSYQGLLGSGLEDLQPASAWCWLATAVAAILGHCFSPWLGFRGGKGVATAFGSMLAMWPVLALPTLIAFLAWAITLAATRFMSLASMVGASILPIVVLIQMIRTNSFGPGLPFLVVGVLIASFVAYRHRSNISRMREGTEPKL